MITRNIRPALVPIPVSLEAKDARESDLTLDKDKSNLIEPQDR